MQVLLLPVAQGNGARPIAVEIHGHGVQVEPGLEEQIVRRMDHAVNRFARAVKRIQVWLEELNGPRGGIDKRCRVVVSMNRKQTVVLQEDSSDLRSLVDVVADRVGEVLGRKVARLKEHHGPRRR